MNPYWHVGYLTMFTLRDNLFATSPDRSLRVFILAFDPPEAGHNYTSCLITSRTASTNSWALHRLGLEGGWVIGVGLYLEPNKKTPV